METQGQLSWYTIPADMAKPLTYNSTLVAREDLTSALAIFKVKPDEPFTGEPRFLPGQYTVLGLNNEAQVELGSVRRPMSIVSAPEEDDVLEFYIRYVNHPESDNPLTHLLWKTKAGDRIYSGPKITGHFTLEHCLGADDPRLKICVAAGTGLAPFISMVRSRVLRDPKADLSDFLILHGASYPADIGYVEELKRLQAENGLHYRASISRPKEAPEWTGDTGRVEDYFKAGRLEDLEQGVGMAVGELTPARAAVLICGLQGTIGQTIVRLMPRGFIPDNKKIRAALEVPENLPAGLFFEQYDSTPVIDLNDPHLVATLKEQLHATLSAG